MQRGRFIFTVVLTLAAAGTGAASPPAPKDVVNLDFSATDVASQLQLNGSAALTKVNGKQVLRLTDGSGGNAASVFTKTPLPPVGDYLATFDFQVQGPDANTPADGGFMYLVQTTGATTVGDAGSNGNNLGYTTGGPGPGTPTGSFTGYSYGLAFSTLSALNFVDNSEIVELRVMGTNTRLNPTPFKMDGEGLLHASLRVQPDSLALTIQGGKDYATAKTVFTSPPWIGNGLFAMSTKPLFFGFTASDTGGQITDIFNLRVQSPAPAQ